MLLTSQLIEHRNDRRWRRSVDNRRSDHSERILGVQTGIVLMVTEENTDTGSVHISTDVRDSQMFLE